MNPRGSEVEPGAHESSSVRQRVARLPGFRRPEAGRIRPGRPMASTFFRAIAYTLVTMEVPTPWPDVVEEVEAGEVAEVVFHNERVVVKYKTGASELVLQTPADDSFIELLDNHGVPWRTSP